METYLKGPYHTPEIRSYLLALLFGEPVHNLNDTKRNAKRKDTPPSERQTANADGAAYGAVGVELFGETTGFRGLLQIVWQWFRSIPLLPIQYPRRYAHPFSWQEIHPCAPSSTSTWNMDAFFAAVEQMGNPQLRGRPVVVGHDGPRGVVATASYEARPFGSHSAQPMAVAKRLSPQAIVVPGRQERYREISRKPFRQLLSR
jgi:hypothetical protein